MGEQRGWQQWLHRWLGGASAETAEPAALKAMGNDEKTASGEAAELTAEPAPVEADTPVKTAPPLPLPSNRGNLTYSTVLNPPAASHSRQPVFAFPRPGAPFPVQRAVSRPSDTQTTEPEPHVAVEVSRLEETGPAVVEAGGPEPEERVPGPRQPGPQLKVDVARPQVKAAEESKQATPVGGARSASRGRLFRPPVRRRKPRVRRR